MANDDAIAGVIT